MVGRRLLLFFRVFVLHAVSHVAAPAGVVVHLFLMPSYPYQVPVFADKLLEAAQGLVDSRGLCGKLLLGRLIVRSQPDLLYGDVDIRKVRILNRLHRHI